MTFIVPAKPGFAGWRSGVARNSEGLQTGALSLLSLLLAARFVQVHAHRPLGPDLDLPAASWFGWADQAAYFLAAHGWATGDLSPAHHLYPAGYALLAAPFVPFMPEEPFYGPNLICWIGALWLFASLAARIGRGVFANRLTGGVVFFLATVASGRAFYMWEIPWTSTPAATLAFAALLTGLRCGERAAAGRAGLAAGLAGLIVLFRPTDAVVLMAAVAAMVAWAAARHRRWLLLPAAAAGFCAGPLLLLLTHWLTHGWTLGYYFENSRLIGFEWRLLPLRWVSLVLSPEPAFGAGDGLEAFFPYLLPGIAGVLASIAAGRGRDARVRHTLVGGTACGFLCLYLCYRDLHVQGLNQFMNYHYFKWALPVFALYALNLLHILLLERPRPARLAAGGAALAAVTLLSLWRVELATDVKAAPAAIASDGRSVSLPGGLPRLDQAMLIPSLDDYLSIYFGHHEIVSGGRRFLASVDFKLYPVPFGFMLAPMRPLPGPLSLELAAPLRLDPGAAAVAVRQRLKFGLPCIVLPRRATCMDQNLLRAAH